MTIGIIGLGYVGLPLAVAFAKKYTVWGLDINSLRIECLNKYQDETREITSEELQKVVGQSLYLDTQIQALAGCDVLIVTVPTPVSETKIPDLNPLIKASEAVADILKKGAIVVYESTVYPGVTEDICVPILEKGSGLQYNTDFFVGYSPERINPGDKEHTITKIQKVVSGSTPQCSKPWQRSTAPSSRPAYTKPLPSKQPRPPKSSKIPNGISTSLLSMSWP